MCVDNIILHAFGVTEIGEKEKMKNKLLALAIAFVLIIGTFSFAFVINPRANAGSLLRLDVFTSPSFLQNNYVTINGTGDWPEGSVIHLQAPQYVYVGSDTRYQFYTWYKDNAPWGSGSGPDHDAYLTMDTNHNVTAIYDNPGWPIQYLVTVTVPSDPAWIQNFTAFLYDGSAWQGGTGPTVSAWVNNNTQVKADIKGCFLYAGVGETPATPCVYGKHYNEIARFVNWTGIGIQSIIGDPYYEAVSNPITVNGPMTITPTWEYIYVLFATDEYTNGHVDIRPEQGWYAYCTTLKINATKYTYVSSDNRWRFNYWKVDGDIIDGKNDPACVKAFSGENITIHIDGNHTVKAMYTLQWYVDFTDNTGACWSCVSSQNGFYDENVNQTFTAPQYINQTSTWRLRFLDWYGYQWPPGYFGNLTNRSFTVNVTQHMHFLAEYRYQFYIQVKTSPVDAGLLAKTYLTGWVGNPGWFDYGSTALFGAPLKYGETEWNNGTRLIFDYWYGHSYDNDTSWYVTSARNFTAIYHKEHKVTLSAEPAIFTWEKDYWIPEGSYWPGWCPDAMWTDPGGWTWYFDYWETHPYGNLWADPWLLLYINTSYTAIAHYRLGTTLVVDPLGVKFETAGNAYCHTFDVSIMVTNVKDMYAVQAQLKFDPTHLEIVGIDATPLNSVWPGGWFVADDPDYTDGYDFYATALGNLTNGFTGTAKLVTITFHIIYEPCVPPDIDDWIWFNRADLYYKNGTLIPRDPVVNGKYHLTVLKPALQGVATINQGGKTVTIDVLAVNVTKLHDYRVRLTYDTTQLKLKTYTIINTFLQGVYSITASAGAGWIQISVTETTGYLANGTGPILQLVFDMLVSGSALDKIYFDPSVCRISEHCNLGYVYLYHEGKSPPDYNFLDLLDATMPDPLLGDANLDGVVDIYDLRLVAYYLGKLTTVWGGPAPPSCDFDHDGWITIRDLIIAAVNFGHHI
jgi:hypothetical protein